MMLRSTKFTRFLVLLLAFTGIFGKNSFAQTTLSRGQIAFVSFSTAPNTDKSFSFVTWVDVAAGTHIKFTTNPFNAAGAQNTASLAYGSTSILDWSNTEGAAIAAGTVINIEFSTNTAPTTNRGSVSIVAAAANAGAPTGLAPSFTNGGRALFAYQGSDYSGNSGTSGTFAPAVTFNGNMLFGMCWKGSSGGATVGSVTWLTTGTVNLLKSYLPTELGASSSYNLNNLPTGVNSGQYSGPKTGAASFSAYQAMVANPANWTTSATSTSIDYTGFSASIPITATIGATNVTCNGGSDGTATVSSVSGGTTPYTYSWAPSGGTSATATGLSANTYTCTITDATSASITKTITVTQPAALSVSGTGTLCATTSLTASMSGGTWSSSNTSVATVGSSGVVSGVAAGTAVISYVHTCGTATKGVTVNLANPGTVTGLQTMCATTFIAHSTTGTTGGTWVSSNTAVGTINSATGTMGGVQGAAPGTTTVSYTVTNTCGSMTATVVNTVYPLSDPGVISGSSSVCSGSDVTLTSSSTSTNPFYSHAWSSSATAVATVNAATGVVTGMSAGTSRISYTASGCGNFRTFFTMNVLPTSVSTITGTTTVTAGSTTTLSNTTAGGTWSSTNTAVGTVGTSGIVTGIAAGTTTISYLISNSCGTSAATVNVTVIGPLNATQSQTDVTCNGGSDGTATVVASGGTPSYTYSWAPSGGTAATATGLTAGSYTCTITDAASANITRTFTITEPAALSVSGSGTLCATTTLTASQSGGTWSSSNTDVATVGTGGIVTGVAAGTATISYVHTCGTATKGVTVNLANPGTITGLQTVCVTAFIAHSTTGTAGGTWVSSNVAVGTINAATGTMGGASNGTTTVSYTVTNTCGSMTATKVNTVYALTDPGTISGPSSVCTGADVTMSSSSTTTSAPPYSHAWSSSATAIATVNAATGVVTGMAGGTSRISYTATGCGTFRTFFTMNVLPTSVSTITGTTTVTAGSTTTLSNTTAGGTWSSTNTAVGTVGTSGIVTGIASGTTTISYLISNSCGTSAATVNVTVIGALAATQSQTDVTCNGGSDGTASVTASGGTPSYTYSWAPSGGTAATATGLTAGSYTCTITDAASASINKTFTIAEPAVLSVSGTSTLCATTTLTASMSGGTWSSSNTSVATVGTGGIVTGVAAGTATISYVHTCGTATKGVTVNLANPGTIGGLQTVCATAFIAHSTTGTAGGTWVSSNTAVGTINSSTGTMGGVMGSATATTTISYTVTNSCGSMTATVVNTVYPLTDPGTISGPSSVCTGADVTMSSSSTTTSTPPYSHAWSSSATAIATVNAATGVVTGMAGGTSRISYTATGCGTFRTFFTMNVLPTSVSTITGTSTVTAGSTTTLSNTTAGGTWSSTNTAVGTVGTSGIVTGIASGTTTISYLISNSCGTSAATVNVTVIGALAATQSQTDVTCNGGSDGTASVTASGGTPSYTYSWAPSGGTGSTATGLTAGSYTCTITDAASASINKIFTITEPAALSVSGSGTLCATTTLTASLSGGTWSSSNTDVATVGSTGIVTGVAAGTAEISYVHTCGTATKGVTVNLANPGTITGLQTVCVTAFIAHSTTGTSGGTWVSSNVAVGTINPATGTMGGASNGTTTVSYTVTNTCGSMTATKVNTVYALTDPGTISGPSSVCTGADVTMSSSSTTTSTPPYSHAWSSSATAIATVNAATGVVTGMAGGTSRISYTATGCGTFRTFFTMNVLPTSVSTITGTTTVVAGSTTTLSNTTAGGTWSSTNTAVGTVGTSGIVTGIAAGTTTISYLISNSCGTVAATVNVTVLSSFDATQSQTNVTCNGGSNGTASVSVSGGTPPYTYTWVGGFAASQTTATASGLTAGSYTCTVTDVASNSAVKTFTITEPTAITSSVSATTNVSCNGLSNGAATVVAGGGTPSYSYSWAPSGGTAATATGLAAGTYTCTITDANSCTKTQTVTISQPSVLTSSVSAATNVSCNGLSNGAATIAAGGGTPSYSYSWAPSGGTTATATGLAAGTYTVTITDANSCTKIQTVTISQPSVLTSSVSAVTNVSCNGLSNGAATISASGGTPSYSYSWAPSGGTAATATGLAAGTYTVTITDANSCTKTQTVTVSQPSVITSSVSAVTNVSCNGLSNGAATISASGGTPSYSYSWAPSGGTAATATGLAAGTYTVTITDANSCTKTQAVTISQPSVLTLSVSATTNVSCNGLSNGSATVLASGGTSGASIAPTPPPGYTYSWAPTGGTAATASGLAAGTYTCTVTDAHGCTATAVATISQPSVLTSSVSATTNVSCNGLSNGAATIAAGGGTPSYSYSWAPSGGTAATATGLAAGTYTCTITDANSCTKTQTVTITQPSAVVISSTTNNGPVCAGSTLNLNSAASGGTAPISYSWSGPSSFTSTAQNPTISGVTAAAGGNYTVTVTDANGCTASGTHTTSVSINARPIISSIGNSGPICATFNLNLTSTVAAGSTPYSYSWSGPNSFSATVQNPVVSAATTSATGTYTLNVTDANGCTAASAGTTSAVVNPRPAITSIGNNSPVCTGVALNFTSTASGGTGTLGYSWAGPGTFTSAIANPTISSPATTNSGVYTLTVTDGLGCHGTGTNTVSATVNPRPTISAISNNGPICATFNLNLNSTVTGGTTPYNYSWSGPNSFTATTGSTSITAATTAATGVYTLSVTDANGCIPAAGSSTTAATVNPRPATSAIGNSGPICSGITLNLTSTTTGGTGTLGYAWSGPNSFTATTANPSIASATAAATGTYTLVVTDVNGCIATGSNTTAAVVNDRPVLASISNNGPICSGNTLNLMSTVTGGTAPVLYAWSGPNSFSATNANASITGATTAATGTYTLSVTDANGCVPTAANTTAATVNPLPASITGSNNICIGLTTTLSNATGTGTWSSSDATTASVNASTGVVTGNVLGTATISYTLSTGCYMTTEVSVNPFPSAITGPTSICAGANITLSNTMSGGTWSGSNTTVATVDANSGVVTGLAAGTVTMSYTSDRGCAVSYGPITNQISAISGGTGTCTGLGLSLADATSGGTWSSSNPTIATVGSTSGFVNALSGGSATITYTVGSCYRIQPMIISTAPPAIGGTAEVCAGSTGLLTNALTGGTWTSATPTIASVGNTSGVVTGVNAGTVNITYALSATCKTSIAVTVDPVPLITGNATVCFGTSNTLTSSISGGTWTTSNAAVATVDASGNVNGIATGTVQITYTLPTGCYKLTNVTVAPLPAVPTGANNICQGYTSLYTDVSAPGLSWTSSDPSVATIGITSGVATGVSAGTTIITFMLTSGCINTKQITVNGLPAVITGTPTVCLGLTTTLSSASPGGTWSAATGIATVDPVTGVVTGVIAGTTTIYYTQGYGCSRGQVVTVNPLPGTITGPASLCTGSSATFGNSVTGGTWLSSNTAVASVGSSTGIVTGGTAGTAMLTYTAPTGCIRTTTVTVSGITPITGSSPVCVGVTQTLANATGAGTWTSSNTAVATVNTYSGIVTSVAAGTATISYIVGAGCATATDVTVNTTPATITGTTNVNIGSTTTLGNTVSGGVWTSSNPALGSIDAATGVVTGIATGTIVITYATGSCYKVTSFTVNPAASSISGPNSLCVGHTINLTTSVVGASWSSSNPGIATIGITSGVVYGITAGTVYVTYTAYSGAYSTLLLTVYPQPGATTGPSSVCTGGTATLANATPGGFWSSSLTTFATIDSTSGVVTGIFNGSTVITYNSNGCLALKPVTVNPIPSAIFGATAICTGTPVTMTDATTGGVWSSSTPAVGTISAGGSLIGLSAGTTTVSYAFASTGCARTQVVSVSAMTPNTGSATACTATSTTLSNATTGGTWSSSAAGVATVGTSGIVTGVTAGTSIITYTQNVACKAYTTVTVQAGPAAITGPTSVCPAASVTLASTTTGGTWTSNDVSLATAVAATGVVTGVAAGTTSVSYTIANGCYRTYTMTVKPLPAPITGSSTVCSGVPSTYSDITTGGLSWTSSSTGVAIIGAGSGILTPIAAGTTNVTYTLTTGCFATKTVTVNTAGVITGPSSVSKAASLITPVAYTDPVTGGTWSTSNVSRATIGSGTGLLTGVSAGTVNVLYTANGCTSGLAITITVPREVGNNAAAAEADNVVTLFPNPTSGTFTIRTSVGGTLAVYTLEGKEAQRYTIAAGDNVVTLLSDLAAGVYMCRFTDENGANTMVRLVYQP